MINFSTFLATAAFAFVSLGIHVNNPNHSKLMLKNPADDEDSLVITSPAFKKNEKIPSKFTCVGSNFSPALHIKGMPADAKSFTIIMDDPDAPVEGGFTHWMAWNLDQTMVDVIENYKGGTQGINGLKKKGYTGPCPPQGVHHYHFRVYALDTRLKLPADSDKSKLLKAMEGHILKAGDLVGLFTKMK